MERAKKVFSLVIVIIMINLQPVYAEFELEDTEAMFLNHGSVMLIIDSETGDILDANHAAIKFYGYPYNELIQLNINVINELDDQALANERQLALAQKRNYFIFKHRLKDGEVRDVEVYSYPYGGIDNNQRLFSIIHDITPRVTAEMAVARSRLIIMVLLFVGVLLLGIITLIVTISNRRIKKLYGDMQNLFDNMQESFALHEMILDHDGKPIDYKFLKVNKSFEYLMNMSQEQIIGKTVKALLPETEAYWIEAYGEVALTGQHRNFSNYSKALDSHFKVSSYSPKKGQFVTIITDITEQLKAREEQISLNRLFENMLYSIGEGVIAIDTNKEITVFNSLAEQLTGYNKTEVIGLKLEEIFIIKPEVPRADYQWLSTKEGDCIPIESVITPMFDEHHQEFGNIIVFRDYSDKKAKNDEIMYLSYHDQLTGLYNRRFFEEEQLRLDTERNLPFTVAMIDVNGLKLTNDAFGHMAGDSLLKRVAEILRHECREEDIIARIGGDEFVILFPKTSELTAEAIVNRLYTAVDEAQTLEVVLSVSVGCATKEEMTVMLRDVLANAEERMYRKKVIESQNMRHRTVNNILKLLHEEHEAEYFHSVGVSKQLVLLGKELKLDIEDIEELEVIGRLHDIGKIAVPRELLYKKRALSNDERNEIKKHVENGYQILKNVNAYTSIAEVVLHHHERWDGDGYPSHLKGEAIPLFSRMLTLSDAYDAMIHERPYKKALQRDEAFKELRKQAGLQFDPELVEPFIASVLNKETKIDTQQAWGYNKVTES